jgi:large subunit ribosomal protein L34
LWTSCWQLPKPILIDKKGFFDIFKCMSQTYSPKKKKRARTHGFLARKSTKAGKRTLARRRQKGRWKLTV